MHILISLYKNLKFLCTKTMILKAVHKYIRIYLYLCTKTINPSFKNLKSLIQKPWFLNHSISIYAYTYIDESHPRRSLSCLPAPFNLHLKSLIQKPWFLNHSISIYAYTYISVQKPQIPLSKTMIFKAAHKYICIYLYLCTKTTKPSFKNHDS